MPLPKALLTIGMLGTEHPEVDLSVLGEDGERSERVLLRKIAALKMRERVEWTPKTHENPLPEPCEVDDAPTCSWETVAWLGRVVEHNLYRLLATEWLRLVHQRGEFVPHEAIPIVLSQLHWYQVSSSDMRPVLCKRAKWLIQMNDTYEWLWVMPDIILTISPKELPPNIMHRCLAEIRKTDPDAAREYLRRHWSEIDDKRVIFALDTNLNREDIAFIDNVFDIDGDGQVGFGIACDFVAHLPETQLARTFLKAVSSTLKVRLSSDHLLEVDASATIDPILKRIGMETVISVDHQILRNTPPHIWYEQLGISVADFVELLVKQSTLGRLDAMVEAAEVYGDADFAAHLYVSGYNRIGSDRLYSLAGAIPEEKAEKMALFFLANVASTYKSRHPAHPLLVSLSSPWSDEISNAVVDYFPKVTIEMPFFVTLRYDIISSWIKGLDAGGALPAFEAVLDKRIQAGGKDAKELLPIREFLDFRTQMHKAISNSNIRAKIDRNPMRET